MYHSVSSLEVAALQSLMVPAAVKAATTVLLQEGHQEPPTGSATGIIVTGIQKNTDIVEKTKRYRSHDREHQRHRKRRHRSSGRAHGGTEVSGLPVKVPSEAGGTS